MSHLLCSLLLLIGLAGAARSQSGSEDSVARAQAWLARASRPTLALSDDEVLQLERWLDDLRLVQVIQPERRTTVFALLLDLSALDPGESPPPALQTPWQRMRVGRSAFASLGPALDLSKDGATQRWLAREVLARGESAARARRIEALECLAGRREQETLSGLLHCASAADAQVRELAMRALVGWPDDGVHLFMLAQLAKNVRQPGWVNVALVRQHFQSLERLGTGRAAQAVVAFVRPALVSTNWRDTVRALPLLARIDDTLAVPLLIESLGLWVARREAGGGSRRVEAEFVAELQRRSGRTMGPFPERWSLWWRARSSGTLVDGPGEVEAPTSRAGFYGLRPETDRVTFLIDASGSMNQAVSEGVTRYAQALEQLVGFLGGLEPWARFRVVLFDTNLRVWKDSLQPANRSSIEAAERWVAYQRPDGGTYLRPGVETCLKVGLDGRIDLKALEEDTVIVLCDGETAEGRGWVWPWWREVAEESCVRFHCVQLGGGGNGTLEALAEVSGGKFVRVP